MIDLLDYARNMPFKRGMLVEDEETERRGRLMDVLIERRKRGGRVIKRTAFVRPEGGGCEWEAPFARIRAVDP